LGISVMMEPTPLDHSIFCFTSALDSMTLPALLGATLRMNFRYLSRTFSTPPSLGGPGSTMVAFFPFLLISSAFCMFSPQDVSMVMLT